MRFVLIAELVALVGLLALWIVFELRRRSERDVKAATISVRAWVNVFIVSSMAYDPTAAGGIRELTARLGVQLQWASCSSRIRDSYLLAEKLH